MKLVYNTESGRKKFRNGLIAVCVVCGTAVLLNILLAVFADDNTYTAFTVVNILADVGAAWWGYAFSVTKLVPIRKNIKLVERGQNIGKPVIGTVKSLSEHTTRVQGVDCFRVSLETDDGAGELFLPIGHFDLESEKSYAFTVIENIICAAEVSDEA